MLMVLIDNLLKHILILSKKTQLTVSHSDRQPYRNTHLNTSINHIRHSSNEGDESNEFHHQSRKIILSSLSDISSRCGRKSQQSGERPRRRVETMI